MTARRRAKTYIRIPGKQKRHVTLHDILSSRHNDLSVGETPPKAGSRINLRSVTFF